MRKQTSLLSLTAALIIALFLAYSGWTATTALFAKAKEQEKALEDFRQWRSTYEALVPIQKQWNAAFHSAVEARDVLSLHKLVGTTLNTNLDHLAVEKIDRVKSGETELGLSRVCLTTSGEQGLTFEGDSFSGMVQELKRLAGRNDIEMGRIKLQDFKGKPAALVQGFCLFLKD